MFLLPYVIERTVKNSNQFGFQPHIGCKHAHKLFASILYDVQSKFYELHTCALDLFKGFNSHSVSILTLFVSLERALMYLIICTQILV